METRGLRDLLVIPELCRLLSLKIRKRSWASTNGTVLGCDFTKLPDFDGQRITKFVVVYSFHVNDRKIVGHHTVDVVGDYHNFADAKRAFVEQYPEGEPLHIYYSKKNPDENSLSRDVPELKSALWIAAVGLITLVCVIYYTYVHTKIEETNRP